MGGGIEGDHDNGLTITITAEAGASVAEKSGRNSGCKSSNA